MDEEQRVPAADSVNGSSDPAAAREGDGVTLDIGEPCGVCQFPVGDHEICGNPVYARAASGTLPKYCGAEGQAEFQRAHGTPGATGTPPHLGDRAGYYRKSVGNMTAAEAKQLAEARAAELGIRQHRAPRPPAPETQMPTSTDIPETGERDTRASVDTDLLAALAGGPKVVRLAELLLQAGRVLAELGEDMDALRAECDERVARETQRAQAAEAAAEQSARELADVRAESQSAIERAESAVRSAHDAQLRAEGALSDSRARVADLERQAAEAEDQHRAELDQVRASADSRVEARVAALEKDKARVDRALSALSSEFEQARKPARSQAPVPAAATAPPQGWEPPPDALQTMHGRVSNRQVTRAGGAWYLSNAVAPRPAGWTLDWLLAQGAIVVGPGDPAPVTLTPRRKGN